MNDKEIRKILISWLQAVNSEIRIYQEKSIGASICDLMAVTDCLTGYEIKSDLDNYQRLDRQIKNYDKIFDNDRGLIRRRDENIKAEKRDDIAVCLNILGIGHVKRCADALEQRKIRQGRAVQGENDYQDGSFAFAHIFTFRGSCRR